MSDWFEDAALHTYGFTDDQISQINAALPILQRVLAVVAKEEPDVAKLIPIATMAIGVVLQHQKDFPS